MYKLNNITLTYILVVINSAMLGLAFLHLSPFSDELSGIIYEQRIFIPTLVISIYAIVRTVCALKYDARFWIDMCFAWLIYWAKFLS